MPLQILLSARFVTNLIPFHEFVLIEGCLHNNKACRHLSVLKFEHYTIASNVLITGYQLKAVRLTLYGPTGLWYTVTLWVSIDVSEKRKAAKLVVPFLRNFGTHLPDYMV